MEIYKFGRGLLLCVNTKLQQARKTIDVFSQAFKEFHAGRVERYV